MWKIYWKMAARIPQKLNLFCAATTGWSPSWRRRSKSKKGVLAVEFQAGNASHRMGLRNVSLEQMVPRWFYQPANPPDDFDAFNLMMAEYSRNGVTLPIGESADRIPHFETSLTQSEPWFLEGAYDFVPNYNYRSLRVAVVNNCLAPGLWEFTASDRSGEIYHSWFLFHAAAYYSEVAKANSIDEGFVRKALAWKEEEVPIRLLRLRQHAALVGRVPVKLVDEPIAFSSQDSRRKLQKGYVQIEKDGVFTSPQRLSDLQVNSVFMSDFAPPGKYSRSTRKRFDFSFLSKASHAEVKTVDPLTFYSKEQVPEAPKDSVYLEITIELGEWSLCVRRFSDGPPIAAACR